MTTSLPRNQSYFEYYSAIVGRGRASENLVMWRATDAKWTFPKEGGQKPTSMSSPAQDQSARSKYSLSRGGNGPFSNRRLYSSCECSWLSERRLTSFISSLAAWLPAAGCLTAMYANSTSVYTSWIFCTDRELVNPGRSKMKKKQLTYAISIHFCQKQDTKFQSKIVYEKDFAYFGCLNVRK